MTFASRLSFLTVQVENLKLRQLEVVPAGSHPWLLSYRLRSAIAYNIFYPSLNALLPNPLRSHPLLLTLSLSLSSVFIPLRVGYSSKTICADFMTFLQFFSCLRRSPQPGQPFTMAQSRSRVPLQPSYTFSALLGTDHVPPVLKRHFTAEDIQPVPNSMPPAPSSQAFSASTSRSLLSRKDSAHIMYPMDPSPSDPNTIFLHPPFTSFPNAEKYSQGLTYNVMAENENWFLDPLDFASPTNSNPTAIPYPAQLEPPRGWCPAKKKDLKERGGEPWPEGQEPRLRCTFCRRTYAGVNAKSMWRRHVYEKHKIAMANRRDTANPDRSRRRAGNSALYVSTYYLSAYTDRSYRGELEIKGRKQR